MLFNEPKMNIVHCPNVPKPPKGWLENAVSEI